MGNVHSGSALTRTTVALDSFVGELGGDIIFEKRWVCHLISQLNSQSLAQVWVQLDSWRRWNVAIGMDIWWLRYLLNLILGFLWEHTIEEWKVRERERSDLCRILIIAPVEREALADIANVYNYQTFAETDKAGYIIRQWLASNLYDRIKFVVERQFLSVVMLINFIHSSRPFLSIVEKRWMAFQSWMAFAMHEIERSFTVT